MTPNAHVMAEPSVEVPPSACDCHMHVFGALNRYPAAPVRSYTPQEALLGSWRQVAQAIGLERVVLVQPSAYGADNRCMLDALRETGTSGRGIAQISSATSDDELRELNSAGVRGVRLNPKSVRGSNASQLSDLLRETGRRVEPLGWHLEIYADLALVGDIADAIRDAPVPVVLDHMGGSKVGDTVAALRPLLTLLAAGDCWVKLSGADRVSQAGGDFEDALPLAQEIIKTNPCQVVWGTDWPHTSAHSGQPGDDPALIQFRRLDPSTLMNFLAAAAGDQPTFTRILATNPVQLYGF